MKKAICIVAGLLLGLAVPHASQAQSLSKYQAVFIYTFTKYLEWPDSQPPLVVGVLGNSPVLLELEKSAKTKGGAFKVMKVASMDAIGQCDIVFLPKEQSRNLRLVAQEAKGNHVLIVTEDKELATQGANISFYLDGDKLRFVINKDATVAQDIKISNALLSLAEVI